MNLLELLRIRRHNRKLYKDGIADKSVKVSTAIGWQPTGADGRPDERYQERAVTPSGNVEYSRRTDAEQK